VEVLSDYLRSLTSSARPVWNRAHPSPQPLLFGPGPCRLPGSESRRGPFKCLWSLPGDSARHRPPHLGVGPWGGLCLFSSETAERGRSQRPETLSSAQGRRAGPVRPPVTWRGGGAGARTSERARAAASVRRRELPLSVWMAGRGRRPGRATPPPVRMLRPPAGYKAAAPARQSA
jgi:hypothetical protein